MFIDFEADPRVRLPDNVRRLEANSVLFPASLSAKLSELMRFKPRLGSWNKSLKTATDGLLVRASSLVFAYDEKQRGQSGVSRKRAQDFRSHGLDRYASLTGIGRIYGHCRQCARSAVKIIKNCSLWHL